MSMEDLPIDVLGMIFEQYIHAMNPYFKYWVCYRSGVLTYEWNSPIFHETVAFGGVCKRWLRVVKTRVSCKRKPGIMLTL